jgi:hypothetical protein
MSDDNRNIEIVVNGETVIAMSISLALPEALRWVANALEQAKQAAIPGMLPQESEGVKPKTDGPTTH